MINEWKFTLFVKYHQNEKKQVSHVAAEEFSREKYVSKNMRNLR